jgi:hypothetical protein
VKQRPDWIFLPVELQEGATELPKATYATLIYQTIPGQKCALNGAEAAVSGSVTAQSEPAELGKWAQKETQVISKGEGKQDIWDATAFVEVNTALIFGEGAAYKGKTEVGTASQKGQPQEVAYFEK